MLCVISALRKADATYKPSRFGRFENAPAAITLMEQFLHRLDILVKRMFGAIDKLKSIF